MAGYGHAESTIQNKIKYKHEEYFAEVLSLLSVSVLDLFTKCGFIMVLTQDT
jgi:hypothetical protein